MIIYSQYELAKSEEIK